MQKQKQKTQQQQPNKQKQKQPQHKTTNLIRRVTGDRVRRGRGKRRNTELCFLYLSVELMVTMNEYILFKPNTKLR